LSTVKCYTQTEKSKASIEKMSNEHDQSLSYPTKGEKRKKKSHHTKQSENKLFVKNIEHW